ncbi:ParM/StbA family protein [Acidithiobacillus thiooxidans]|uniref:ParM/StbA family protein n=1 Tax=Acidithiobacillus thiooxidans TaxID=930 RepID=UPI00285D203F|nr:ParM/StbA family protein [Acidithiobacillus thiooxidans]MDR7926445.1 ParM/StbA family protein [Acidithiobacillus thiooxidans]
MEAWGLDDGFGEIKVAWANGKGAIPSLVRPGARLELGKDGQENAIYHTEGQSFTMGGGVDTLNTRFDGYERSAMNRVMSFHALLSHGFAEGDTIVTGLPVRLYFRSDGSINKEAVAARKISLQVEVLDADKKPLPKPGKIKVVAQGLAALMALDCGSAAILDVGARTMDATVFQDGRILMDRTGGRNLGVLDMQARFAERIAGQFAYPLESHLVYRAFRDGRIKVMGKEYDLAEDRQAAIQDVSLNIWQEAASIFKTVQDVDTVVLIGGGASFLMESSPWPHVQVADDPVFANAQGMLAYGL